MRYTVYKSVQFLVGDVELAVLLVQFGFRYFHVCYDAAGHCREYKKKAGTKKYVGDVAIISYELHIKGVQYFRDNISEYENVVDRDHSGAKSKANSHKQ